MKERYSLPLTKREAKQLFTYLLQAEKDGGKTKEYWSRHEKIAEKLQGIIYECKEPHYKPLTLRSDIT